MKKGWLLVVLCTSLVVSSCQNLPVKPDLPQCISNGDGTSSCTDSDGSYIEDNLNHVTYSAEDHLKLQQYISELELSLSIICKRRPKLCD